MMNQTIIRRIQALQDELETLKQMLNSEQEKCQPTTKIKGLWKDIIITDEDLTEAKKSVFRDVTWE